MVALCPMLHYNPLNAVRAAIGDTGEEQRLIKTLPRKGFRFVGQVRETREVADPNPRDAPESALALPDKPCIAIAVLPFENMSGDKLQQLFADKENGRGDHHRAVAIELAFVIARRIGALPTRARR